MKRVPEGKGREAAFDLSGDGDVKITGPAPLSVHSLFL